MYETPSKTSITTYVRTSLVPARTGVKLKTRYAYCGVTPRVCYAYCGGTVCDSTMIVGERRVGGVTLLGSC